MRRCNTFKFFREKHCCCKTSMNERKRENNDIKDDIIRDYDSIIRESALLTTVSGFYLVFFLIFL
jgi:ribosome-binding protein aMBF1 (putative translation factor)